MRNWIYGAVACAALACGDDEDLAERPHRPGPAGPVADGGTVDPQSGATIIRRLNRVEYDNTVRDLLGDTSAPATKFAPETRVDGFDNNAAALTISPSLINDYLETAEALATKADLTKLLGCDPASADDACVRTFVTTFGKRAMRRPLAPTEIDAFIAMYQAIDSADGDHATAIRAVIARFLQTPDFLYRVETSGAGSSAPARLNAWETASRLSYLLWSSMPDDALFAAAEANQLGTPALVATQAERMLKDPRAREMVKSFHDQWLGLTDLDQVPKVDPQYPTLRPLLRQETSHFVEHVLFDGEHDLTTLLSAPFSYVNGALAPFYGASATGDAFVRVPLDPKTRAGVLTQGAFLSRMAKADRSAPILRGVFVLTRLLCRPPQPPPINFDNVGPDGGTPMTTRAFYTDLTSPPSCQNCHKTINGIGFGFEHYDAVGAFRDTENGLPVDATGSVLLDGKDVAFADGVALAQALAKSHDVQDCFVKQWFRFAYGRREAEADQKILEGLASDFRANGADVLKLVVGLTKTDVFSAPQYTAARLAR